MRRRLDKVGSLHVGGEGEERAGDLRKGRVTLPEVGRQLRHHRCTAPGVADRAAAAEARRDRAAGRRVAATAESVWTSDDSRPLAIAGGRWSNAILRAQIVASKAVIGCSISCSGVALMAAWMAAVPGSVMNVELDLVERLRGARAHNVVSSTVSSAILDAAMPPSTAALRCRYSTGRRFGRTPPEIFLFAGKPTAPES